MTTDLNKEHITSIRRSYFNILALFLEREKIESRFTYCLLKWGFQLQLSPDDLSESAADISQVSFKNPDKLEKLEAIYHLVFMIYLDRVVEDVELEVAIIYAQKLGFKSEVVNELFTAIATANYDHADPWNVREEVINFLKLHEDEI